MAKPKNEVLTIIDVGEMPPRRRGRPGVDVGRLVAALRDRKPHAIEDVGTDEQRRRWRRRLHRAAKQEGVRAETRYVGDEHRLYFRGTEG